MISLFTGRSAVRDGLRMLAIGGSAGAVTYLVGNAAGAEPDLTGCGTGMAAGFVVHSLIGFFLLHVIAWAFQRKPQDRRLASGRRRMLLAFGLGVVSFA